jgi:pantothenate kinase-related protein Tda10
MESVKRDLRDPMLRRLTNNKPVLGYVSGEYGYGKTATMVWLWHELEREGFVAVPPFLFYSWDDLMLATTNWLSFRLAEKRPDLRYTYHSGVTKHDFRNWSGCEPHP